eukprot:COSAG02_NODE_390_length_23244_cov_35.504558_1_plen_949_part_00
MGQRTCTSTLQSARSGAAVLLGNWREQCNESDTVTAPIVHQDSNPPDTQRTVHKSTTDTAVQIAEAEAYASAQLGKMYDLELKGKGKVQLQLSTMGVQVTEKKGRPPITYRFAALQHWNTTDTGFQLTPTQGKVLAFQCIHMQATEIIDGITSKAKELESAQTAVTAMPEEAREQVVAPHVHQSVERPSSGEPRLSLDALRLSELQQRATTAGMQQHELDDVDDSENPKQVTLDRLVSAEPVSAVPLRDRGTHELQSLKLSELKKRASAAGATSEDINSVDDNEDPRQAAIQLIRALQAHDSVSGIANGSVQERDGQRPNIVAKAGLEKTLAMEAKMLHIQEETQAMLLRMQEEANRRELAAKANAQRETEAVAKAAAEAAAARIKAETDAVLESVTRTAAATEARYEALVAQQKQEVLQRQEVLRTEHAIEAEHKQLHRTKQDLETADAVAQVEAQYKHLQRELLAEREERRRAEQRIQEQADARAKVATEMELEAHRQVAETKAEAARQAEEVKLEVERKTAEAKLEAKQQAILLQAEAAASKQEADDAKLQAARAKVKLKQEAQKARLVAQKGSASQSNRRYRVVRKAAIRAGFSTESEQVGVLESNQDVDAIDVKKNEAGQTRVHVKQANGWVSTKSKSGKVLLRKLDGVHSADAPQSRLTKQQSALREPDSTSDDSSIHRGFPDEDVDAAKHRARRASRQRQRRRPKPLSEAVRHASEESVEIHTSPEQLQKQSSIARGPALRASGSATRGPDQSGEAHTVRMKSSMTFAGSFSEFPVPGSSKRATFEDEFKRAIVRCFELSGVGVSAINVDIIGYRAGSVVVDFAISGLPSSIFDEVGHAVCEQASVAARSLTGFRVCEFAAVHNPMAPFVETAPPGSLPATPTCIPMVEDRDHSGYESKREGKRESLTDEPFPSAVLDGDETRHNEPPADILGYHYHVLND